MSNNLERGAAGEAGIGFAQELNGESGLIYTPYSPVCSNYAQNGKYFGSNMPSGPEIDSLKVEQQADRSDT